MERTYTVGDVERLTGGKRRSIQLWSDHGVLRPTEGTARAGTGTHKRFDLTELRIAALMVPLAAAKMPIGSLYNLARNFRELYVSLTPLTIGTWSVDDDPTTQEMRKCMSDALAGTVQAYIVFSVDRRGGRNLALTTADDLLKKLDDIAEEFTGLVNITKCWSALRDEDERSG